MKARRASHEGKTSGLALVYPRAMRVLVGTSGYSYKEWKGSFYPADLPAGDFLRYYAARLPTVEINNTFYRMPTAKLVQSWAEEAPDGFVFAVKAPQRITHMAKLQGASELVLAFTQAVAALGPRLGPLLFQLPPFLRKDVDRLRAFLGAFPPGHRVAFEFRHASWFADDVWAALREHGAALCVAEGEKLESPLEATAPWGYVRLRRDEYSDALLDEWAQKIRRQPWEEAFVYVKHDDGDAPSVAARLRERLA
jgi:uncharacterized protein YecE (DUF72 family)